MTGIAPSVVNRAVTRNAYSLSTDRRRARRPIASAIPVRRAACHSECKSVRHKRELEDRIAEERQNHDSCSSRLALDELSQPDQFVGVEIGVFHQVEHHGRRRTLKHAAQQIAHEPAADRVFFTLGEKKNAFPSLWRLR